MPRQHCNAMGGYVYHVLNRAVGTEPLYQGRFKSFPVEDDEHFSTVCRYVERHALRADLVGRAEDWRWSSRWHCVNRSRVVTLDKWPVARGRNWIQFVNDPETEAERKALRRSVRRGTPLGTSDWQQRTAKRLGLESSLREPGRPRNEKATNK